MYLIRPDITTSIYVISYLVLVRMICYYLLIGVIAKTVILYIEQKDKTSDSLL